jgi:glutamate dehydrogenase
MLKDVLVEPGIYQDVYLAQIARAAFPASLQAHYSEALSQHRLHPQIVATQLANEMVNNLGITTPLRLKEASGASWVEFAKAYTAAREVLQFEVFQQQIMDDPRFSAAQQMQWFSIMSRRLRRVTRWYLHLRTELMSLERLIPLHRQALQSVNIFLRSAQANDTQALQVFQNRCAQWQSEGVPARLAELLAMPENLFSHIGVVQQGIGTGENSMVQVESCGLLAMQYHRLKAQLKLGSFIQALAAIPISNNWQSQVRDTYLLDIERKLSQLAALSLPFAQDLPAWLSPCNDLLGRWNRVIEDIEKQGLQDFAVFAVAMNMLGDIAKRLTN